MGVHLGTCHHWNDTANFGFLRPDAPIVDDLDRDLFVGRKSLAKSGLKALRRGDRVSFDIGRAKDGRPEAINVSLVADDVAEAA